MLTKSRLRICFSTVFALLLMLPALAVAQLNITVNGSLGDLDGNTDGGTGEAAVVNAVVNCWSARVLTNRNFTLTIAGGSLGGSTIGQGRVNTVSGGVPVTGNLTMDNDGSTVYFVDTTPNTSTEWMVDDPASPWRLRGGPAMVDLYSVFNHETGHALAWLSAVGCGGSNPGYDALLNPMPPYTMANATCVVPFPTRGQPQLPGCVQLIGTNYNVSLRGEGVGDPCNDLSHPGIRGDLMLGFYRNNARETASIEDVDLFRVAFNDTVNLPPLVNAGNDIVSECNTIGGSDVTLDGSGSTDADNDPLTFNWTCPGVALSTPNSVMTSGFFALDQTVNCRMDATDLAACPADADFVQVSVEDTTDPDVTCPSNVTVECDQPTNPFNTGQGIGDDICDVAPLVSFADAEAPGVCLQEKVITRTWTATDGSNNDSSCDQLISVVDTTPPDLTCPDDVTVECTETGGTPATDAGIAAFLGGAAAVDACDDSLSITNDAPGFFVLGTTPVEFSIMDDCSNGSMCSALVNVVDTTPPDISQVVASPDVLWPPNHRMVAVDIDVAVNDVCDDMPTCQITSVSSNEPIDGLGDGTTSPDWVVTGDLSLNLRAERSGPGDARSYTIEVTCTDGSSNSNAATVAVRVPHDRRRN